MNYRYYIYQHYIPDSKIPFYIGKGKVNQNGNVRAFSKRNRNTYWKNIVNKFGYLVNITHENICNDEASSIEKYLIDFFGRRDLKKGNLVNLTDGGEGSVNYKHSHKSKDKIGQKSRSRGQWKGNKNPFYGKSLSELHKKKISDAAKKSNKKRVISEETKEKISKSLKKYFNQFPEKKAYLSSNEHRIKVSQSLKGRTFNQEWKNKISNSKKKKIAI